MVALRDLTRLGDDLDRLAGALEDLCLTAELSSLRGECDRLSRTIRDYLIPRTADPETALTVVFAGPTGSGKSTLINSLAGLELSIAGPLRPTTKRPVILIDVGRGAGFSTIAGIECQVTAGAAQILESMILVDTPDIDSTSTDHRDMAETLIDNADVVVFVTSALRYADAVPWQVLRRAESRGADVIHVLNRVGSSTRGSVVDFQARLRSAGLSDEVIVVPEHRLATQILPAVAVRPLRRQLAHLAGDRASTTGRALDRVLRATLGQTEALYAALREAADSRDATREEMVDVLVARVGSLDLSGVAEGLVIPPAGGTPREAKRWISSARRGFLSEEEVDRVLASIEARLVRDLRIWLSDAPDSVLGRGVETGQLLSGVVPVARLALRGWVDFVRRIAEEEAPRNLGLAESVLVLSATDPSDTLAAGVLFGERAPDIVARARRELVGRLEVVYQQAAAHMTEMVETESGAVDVSGLRATLASVTSSLALVDA